MRLFIQLSSTEKIIAKSYFELGNISKEDLFSY